VPLRGRVSAVAIGETPEQANDRYLQLSAMMDDLASRGD